MLKVDASRQNNYYRKYVIIKIQEKSVIVHNHIILCLFSQDVTQFTIIFLTT